MIAGGDFGEAKKGSLGNDIYHLRVVFKRAAAEIEGQEILIYHHITGTYRISVKYYHIGHRTRQYLQERWKKSNIIGRKPGAGGVVMGGQGI